MTALLLNIYAIKKREKPTKVAKKSTILLKQCYTKMLVLFSVFKQKLIVFSNEYVEYIKNILKYLTPNRKAAAYLIK